MTKIIKEAFVAVYDHKDGDIGFLGNDTHSGGNPYFTSDQPDSKYLREDPAAAQRDVNMIKNTMRNFYGNGIVNFDTVRVVRYVISLEDVPNLEQEIHNNLIESAKEKLNSDEFHALIHNVLGVLQSGKIIDDSKFTDENLDELKLILGDRFGFSETEGDK